MCAPFYRHYSIFIFHVPLNVLIRTPEDTRIPRLWITVIGHETSGTRTPRLWIIVIGHETSGTRIPRLWIIVIGHETSGTRTPRLWITVIGHETSDIYVPSNPLASVTPVSVRNWQLSTSDTASTQNTFSLLTVQGTSSTAGDEVPYCTVS
jgi:hypothetical protein